MTEKRRVDQTLRMEHPIRKMHRDLGTSVNLVLAVVLGAACSVNALLLYAHL